MEKRHRLLKRQMEEYLSNAVLTDDLQAFLAAVNQAYFNQDKDRSLLERSIEISSQEYNENMEKIRQLQSQLVQQEKMAGIGQLSAGIAHEINNPLGYTQSNLETLKKYIKKIKGVMKTMDEVEFALKEEPSVDRDDILQRITDCRQQNKLELLLSDLDDVIAESIDGLGRIEKIVQSLLGFARNSPHQFEDYDLNKGILNTLAIVNNEIKYFARVDKDLGDIPCIKARGGLINQALLNLIVNAVHAIKEKAKQGMLMIKTFAKEGYVYCLITDNGIGIPQVNLADIFTPFFTTKPVGKGTGLGLSITYDIIVNKHGGEIHVESEEGVGTTFILQLPIEQEMHLVNKPLIN